MKRVLLRNGTLINLEPMRLEKTDLLVVEGKIAAKAQRLVPDRETSVYDCRGRFIMPGFVNGYLRLSTSQSLGMPRPANLMAHGPDAHEALHRRVEESLTPETIVTTAFAGVLDAVRSGATTLFARHASPAAIAHSMDLVRDVMLTVGVRSVLAYDVAENHMPERTETALVESRRFASGHRSDKLAGAIACGAPSVVGDVLLRRVAEEVRLGGRTFQTSLGAVPPGEASRELDLLLAEGLVGPGTVIAHGLYVTPEERARVRDSGAWIVHCPTADAIAGRGVAPFESFGENVTLGTERSPSDMFAEARAAFIQARARGASIAPEDIVRLLVGGHQLASEILGIELGSTFREAGADLLVLNYQPRTPLREDNLAEHIVFGMNAAMIETVLIDGNVVYHQGRFPEIDIPRLLPLIQRGAAQLWSAVGAPAAS